MSLTIAYCRVSTTEQAAEGYSIDGQAERLTAYAELHDLGTVTVISDPGRSGKDLERPGLQQVLQMVDDGHVAHVLTWRLDRLSRNLHDLILLADRFGQADVALHSFTERLDLSSATGRMFYNILGSFAQFYREQLSENVRMGMHQAARQGRWTNRPPTGYDLVDGVLVANDDAVVVRQIYRLRLDGMSQREIAERTGVNHSTVLAILRNRTYLGLVKLNGEHFPGLHEALVSEEDFAAVSRGRIRGRRRGRDLMSGRVRCGLCERAMTLDTNGSGHSMYRCRHRGEGCELPRRSANGLLRAAVLGLRLIGRDEDLQAAIRTELRRGRREGPQGSRRHRQDPPGRSLDSLTSERSKLLRLHYADQISAELFAEEERRLTLLIEAHQAENDHHDGDQAASEDLLVQFEAVAELLAELDLDRLWEAATDQERRILLDELLDRVAVFHDHLEVHVHGAPRINVTLAEVGLGQREQISGVGGPP